MDKFPDASHFILTQRDWGSYSAAFLELELEAREYDDPGIQTIVFNGACPALYCVELSPHVHNLCPICGTLRYNKIGCLVCTMFHRSLLTTQCIRCRGSGDDLGPKDPVEVTLSCPDCFGSGR